MKSGSKSLELGDLLVGPQGSNSHKGGFQKILCAHAFYQMNIVQ